MADSFIEFAVERHHCRYKNKAAAAFNQRVVDHSQLGKIILDMLEDIYVNYRVRTVADGHLRTNLCKKCLFKVDLYITVASNRLPAQFAKHLRRLDQRKAFDLFPYQQLREGTRASAHLNQTLAQKRPEFIEDPFMVVDHERHRFQIATVILNMVIHQISPLKSFRYRQAIAGFREMIFASLQID